MEQFTLMARGRKRPDARILEAGNWEGEKSGAKVEME